MIRSLAGCSSLAPLFRAVWRNNRRLPRGMEGERSTWGWCSIYLQEILICHSFGVHNVFLYQICECSNTVLKEFLAHNYPVISVNASKRT